MIPGSRNEGWGKQSRLEHQYKVVLAEPVTALGIGAGGGVGRVVSKPIGPSELLESGSIYLLRSVPLLLRVAP